MSRVRLCDACDARIETRGQHWTVEGAWDTEGLLEDPGSEMPYGWKSSRDFCSLRCMFSHLTATGFTVADGVIDGT